MKKQILTLVYAVLLSPALVFAASSDIDKCVAEVKAAKPGDMVKLEALDVQGKTVYEFEVKDSKGLEWELMCDVATGKIIEIESEPAAAEVEVLKKAAKFNEADAMKVALTAFPGKLKEIEYELEANKDFSYEIDIIGKNGVETKVEVDAATGKIIETATEKWAVGEEAVTKR